MHVGVRLMEVNIALVQYRLLIYDTFTKDNFDRKKRN